MCAVARFYESMRRCGAQGIQLVLDDPREWILGPDSAEGNSLITQEGISGYLVESPHATLIVTYSSGSSVFSRGSCRALYHYQPSGNQVVDQLGRLIPGYPQQMVLLLSQLEYDFVEHTEMVSRAVIKAKVPAATATVTTMANSQNGPLEGVESQQSPKSQRTPNPNNTRRPYEETEDTDAQKEEDATRPAKKPKIEVQSGSKEEEDAGAIVATKGNNVAGDRQQDEDKNRQNMPPPPLKNDWNTGFREYSIPGPPVRDTGLSDETMRVLEVSRDALRCD